MATQPKLIGLKPGKALFRLMNAQGGNLYRTEKVHEQSGTYQLDVPLRQIGVSSGVYWMQWHHNGELNTKRVILQ
jgi:hypothetical protein